MPLSLEKILKLADQFEKNAVDVEQPPEFDDDYSKWLKMTDKEGPTTVREMKAVRVPEKMVEVKDPTKLLSVIQKLQDKYDSEGSGDTPLRVEEKEVEPHEGPVEKMVLDLGTMDQYDADVKTAAEKKKLDPKAKVRNRGTVCVPASSAKDKKDHFPINDEAQARNALARVHQYSKVPSWYSGSLKSLQELVSRKVHSKYKGIGKDKKSSIENLMVKYATLDDMTAFLTNHYEGTAALLRDLAKAQFTVGDKDPNDTNDEDYAKNKQLHDMIMELAARVEPIEQSMW